MKVGWEQAADHVVREGFKIVVSTPQSPRSISWKGIFSEAAIAQSLLTALVESIAPILSSALCSRLQRRYAAAFFACSEGLGSRVVANETYAAPPTPPEQKHGLA